ncbi:unnamed protein product [Rotaria sp. Silwood1]|nr:unnamed protein product [Rotaria sp. Silwood1]
MVSGRGSNINTSNLSIIVRELFQDNIIRDRGLLVRSIIQAQIASTIYTPVYAALLHETVALEILVRLLEKPIDDSIILVIGFLKEYGQKLLKDNKFKVHPSIPFGLDLIHENDQYTHMIKLDASCEPEIELDVFKYDEQYEDKSISSSSDDEDE